MPIREFGCEACDVVKEVIHPSFDPTVVPAPDCPRCTRRMDLLISTPRIDTSATFNRGGGGAFTWRGPTGLYHEIDSLHRLRQVEKTYQDSGHNVRFDAWSGDQSNPDPIDGFGPEYWSGDHKETKRLYSKW